MQQRQSLELTEITDRIGTSSTSGAASSSKLGEHLGANQKAGNLLPTAASLVTVAQSIATEAEQVGEHIIAALSARVAVLACIPVHAPSPWASVAVPEIRTVVSGDITNGVSYPRGLGGSTLSLTWEAVDRPLGARLILLWSGGGGREAELHICRVSIVPGAPGTPPPARLEYARFCVGRAIYPEMARSPAHFLLCKIYEPGQVVALVLHERPALPGGAAAVVCLVDYSEHEFDIVTALQGGGRPGSTLPPLVSLDDLPEGAVRRSVDLPDCYSWASALSAMAARGVCSIYAWRARRLLTLDMRAEGEEDDDDDD